MNRATIRGGSRLSHWGGTNFSSSGMYFGWKNEGAKRPRIEGEARNEGEARDISGGRGLGRGLGEPLPRKFLKIKTLNRSFWCIVDTKIRTISQVRHSTLILLFKIIVPMSTRLVTDSVLNPTVRLEAMLIKYIIINTE